MSAVARVTRRPDDEVAQLRAPPHSLEAEQSVLGALLIENGAWTRVRDQVAGSDFYRLEHRLIFEAIGDLVDAGQPADLVTVFDHLTSQGDDCGGIKYLNELAASVASAVNVVAYATIVRKNAIQRKLIATADEIATQAFNPQARPVSEIVSDATDQLRMLAAESSGRQKATPVAPRMLDLASLAPKSPPARHWFRPEWLGTGATLLPAKGGEGKSGMTQHEATCGALGRAYFAPAAEPYRSLLWNCEDDHDDMWRRQARICEHEQIDMGSTAGKLFLESRYGCENALIAETKHGLVWTSLIEELREQVNDLRIDVLWLDNVAHVCVADHDNRTHVTQFINGLNGLVTGRPFGVVLVAHVNRAAGSEFSGSVAWENASRMRWYLGSKLPDEQRDGEDDSSNSDTRFIAKRKSNYSARDYVRMTMMNGLLVPDAEPDRITGIVAALDEKRADQICIAGFKSLCAMGIRTTDGKTSPDYLPSQMTVKGLAAGYSRSEIGRAMNRLMGRGVFVRAPVGQHPNRSPKFGLVLREGEV